MGHMSNRERIARMAEEAALAAAEKAAKRSAKGAGGSTGGSTGGSKRSPKAPVRMKIVWEVCNATGKVIRTFPYAEKAAAEAETQELMRSTGNTHLLRPTKVAMDLKE